MARRSNAPLLVSLALAALVAGGVAYVTIRSGDRPVPVAAGPGAALPGGGDAAAPAAPEVKLRAPEGLLPPKPGTTTVAWPVKLALEQVSAAHLPEAPDVPPLGGGRNARFDGRVLAADERGVRGTVEFVAGPNAGRVLPMNERGEFGATDLYSGLNIVRVQGPGIPGSLREVRLRTSKGEVMNIGYGLPGTMVGTVFGPDGEPLEGVAVECDGRGAVTDAEGVFFYPEMAGGTNLVLTLSKPGYARYFQVVGVGSARQMSLDRYKFRLHPEAVLEVSVSSAAGGPGPTQVILLPANTQVARDYPWWQVSPAEVAPGTSLVIEGLPPIKIALRTFHPGAVAKPADRRVNLRAGGRAVEEIALEPGPSIRGTVRDGAGRAVPDATVALEAPDRAAALLFYLKEMPYFMETEVVPTMPMSAQATSTDSYGRYTLSAWGQVAKGMYLTAQSPDGLLWAGQVVRPPAEEGADTELDLVLEPLDRRSGSLEIEFPGRVQGTPVEVTVDGEPVDPGIVPLERPLLIEDLGEGTWRLSGVWNGADLFPAPGYRELEVEGRTRTAVNLPEGAIYGQDEDTLLRAAQQP